MNILFIGNSFSDDTMEHATSVLQSLGVRTMSLGNLYIGGCSIHRHVDNAANDRAWYEYRTNTGSGWTTTPDTSLRMALTSKEWDAVAIQTGTADGSRNTCEQCYDFLPILLKYIRSLCKNAPKIVFNMTWVGESWNGHPEVTAHHGDQMAMYREITRIVRDIVAPQVDAVSPAGTAIQNARAVGLAPLNRDGYHLSLGLGRYIAALTFIATATGSDITGCAWHPDGVTAAQAALARQAVQDALQTPFEVTVPVGLAEGFVSDTSAGCANQTTFESDNEWHTARVYSPVTIGGDAYTFLFTDAIDTTFADGARSTCNTLCGDWSLSRMRVGVCTASLMDDILEPSKWTSVTFDGQPSVVVSANAWIESDPVFVMAAAGETLCVEYQFRGKRMPCHEELWVASFVDGQPSVSCPVPSRVAVRRDGVRIGLLGDSITQGIGSTKNSGRHWAALTAKALGERYAVWNLGIGFARSVDAASNGAWLRKAKENDVILVCLGINDLKNGFTAADVCENLRRTVMLLRSRGIRVFAQTVPPFEGLGEARNEVNVYIRETLVCDGVFETSFLAAADGTPLYGGHPNDDGSALWANKLTAWLKENL